MEGLKPYDYEAACVAWRKRAQDTLDFLDAFLLLPIALSAAWGIVQWRQPAMLAFGLFGAVLIAVVYLTNRRKLKKLMSDG
jgi:hypothetical protein